jgi:hypothetical protein
MYGRIFDSFSVYVRTIVAILFLLKPPRTTVWETLI